MCNLQVILLFLFVKTLERRKGLKEAREEDQQTIEELVSSNAGLIRNNHQQFKTYLADVLTLTEIYILFPYFI